MSPTIAVSAAVLGTRRWRQSASHAESLARKAVAAVRTQASILKLTSLLWRLDGMLRDLLESFYRGVENPEPSPKQVAPEELQAALKTLRETCNSIDDMYSKGKAAGLTNRRLVGAALNSIRVRSDEMIDIVESVELAMDPRVDSIFDDALAQFRAGNVIDLGRSK